MNSPTFAETTRCQDCSSDQIYVLQDDGSGICWRCKAMVAGPVIGGFGYLEAMRLMKIIPGDEKTVNDRDREEALRVKLNRAVETVKEARAVLPKLETAVKAAHKPEAAPTGPGFLSKIGGWAKSKIEEIKKAANEVAKEDKAKEVLPVPAKAPPVPAALTSVKNDGLPKFGEAWTVGKCRICGLMNKVSGVCFGSKATGSSRRYIEIKDVSGTPYYGCFICARKVC